MPIDEIERLATQAVRDAAALGHDMALVAGARHTRKYECLRCGLAFTVGYTAVVGGAKLSSPGVIAGTALTTPCNLAA